MSSSPNPRTEEGEAATTSQESVHNVASLDGRSNLVRSAYHAQFPSDHEGPFSSVEEVHSAFVIVLEGDDLQKIPYTLDSEQQVTFGDPEKVIAKVTFKTIGEGVEPDDVVEAELERVGEAFASTLLESLDDGIGKIWRVTMVRPGTSRNGRRYRKEVLKEAAPLYEGAKAFDGHRSDTERRASSVRNLVGWHQSVATGDDGSLQSDFHITESADHVRKLFVSAWKANRPDLIGFSHDVSAYTEAVIEEGRRISDVTKIVEVHSTDVVSDPSAGGRIERLVASRQEGGSMPDDERSAEGEAHEEEEAGSEAGEEGGAVATATETAPTPVVEEVTESESEGEAEEILEAGTVMHRLVVREAIGATNLPEQLREALTKSLAESPLTEVQIVARVKEQESLWDTMLKAAPSPLPGQGGLQTEVGKDEADKLQERLDATFGVQVAVDAKAPAFGSIKEAYHAFTGRHAYNIGNEDLNRMILAESIGCVPSSDARRLTEALTTSWAQALGDSITRSLIQAYNFAPLQSWRMITSNITSPTDFRTQRRVRIGGFDVLAIVGENAAYPALTTPTDEEATYAVDKYGGTEFVTLEMIANDDLGGIVRIPQAMGRAAVLTLYRAIWVTTIAGNAVIYDAVALFAAGHNNDEATTPLDEAGLGILRRKMVEQTALDETSGFVGVTPRFLAVPADLFVQAFKFTESSSAVVGTAESATVPNLFQSMTAIEVPLFTDVNDWFMIADPATIPTIEVGFLNGRQDPEILVQDQPAVGTVFTNDRVTYKVRHIWALTVLDFRGFQRATQI